MVVGWGYVRLFLFIAAGAVRVVCISGIEAVYWMFLGMSWIVNWLDHRLIDCAEAVLTLASQAQNTLAAVQAFLYPELFQINDAEDYDDDDDLHGP